MQENTLTETNKTRNATFDRQKSLFLDMAFIKRLVPNSIKQEVKYFLQDLLKIRYNRFQLPVEIEDWVSRDKPITFIDVGACRGNFSYALSNTFDVKTGILIEPLPHLVPGLKSRFPNEQKFKVLNLAVSKEKGETEFYFSELNEMSSLFEIKSEFYDPFVVTSAGEKIKVQMESLDNIAEQCRLEIIDLLKIDVQGAEHIVLESGPETLKRTKVVYIEVSYRPMYKDSSDFFDIYKFLNNKNFRFGGTTPVCTVNGELMQADAIFINNFLCP